MFKVLLFGLLGLMFLGSCASDDTQVNSLRAEVLQARNASEESSPRDTAIQFRTKRGHQVSARCSYDRSIAKWMLCDVRVVTPEMTLVVEEPIYSNYNSVGKARILPSSVIGNPSVELKFVGTQVELLYDASPLIQEYFANNYQVIRNLVSAIDELRWRAQTL